MSFSVSSISNETLPLDFFNNEKLPDFFNFSTSEHFDPPPPPGGLGAPVTYLFNQPFSNLAPPLKLDFSFLKDFEIAKSIFKAVENFFNRTQNSVKTANNLFQFDSSVFTKQVPALSSKKSLYPTIFDFQAQIPPQENLSVYGVVFSSPTQNVPDTTQVIQAILSSDIDSLKQFAIDGFDFNRCSYKNLSFVHLAAILGKVDVLKFLRSRSIPLSIPIYRQPEISPEEQNLIAGFIVPNDASALGMSAAHLAALNGNANVLQFLHDNGVDLNTPTKNGVTPLALACIQRRNRNVLRWFLLNNFSFTEKVGACSLPFFAAMAGAVDTLRFMYENRVQLNINFAELLNSHNLKTNPIIASLFFPNLEALNFFDEIGANFANTVENKHYYYYAASAGNIPALTFLIQKLGLNLNPSLANEIAYLALQERNSDQSGLKILNFLESSGVSLVALHKEDPRALEAAIQFNKVKCVTLLHKQGVDISEFLELATECNATQVLGYFLSEKIKDDSKVLNAIENASKSRLQLRAEKITNLCGWYESLDSVWLILQSLLRFVTSFF